MNDPIHIEDHYNGDRPDDGHTCDYDRVLLGGGVSCLHCDALPPKDDGEAAIARERALHEEADRLRGVRDAAFDGLQAELAFKQKLRDMRASKSIPAYHGPRAAK